ncbi:hypothetical protein MBLNU459_g6142t1 [Dothideomycetes sp. NU459]
MSSSSSSSPAKKETYRPAFPSGDPNPMISYGLPFAEACAKHVGDTFHASRVYVLASGSLARDTAHVGDLEAALAGRVVGVRRGMTPHTLWSEILAVTDEAREGRADLIVTLGAGSLTDAAKIVVLALANDVSTVEGLEKLHSGSEWLKARPDLKAPEAPIICIPTSLSGGEYTKVGGGTDDRNHRKSGFCGPSKGPALVILDPALTTTTPDSIWLSTGIRAVDHCVEAMCSLESTDSSNEAASQGLRALVPGLLRCKANKDDLEARQNCQLGVIDAIRSIFVEHIPLGGSHAIGHQLGPLGVGHGETSCILLPAVCKYNAKVNSKQQQRVRDVLWEQEVVAEVLKRKGLSRSEADLGDMLDTIIRELGMPRSLSAVGVGEDSLDVLAENSLTDPCCPTNPIPLKEKEQVMAILRMVVA